ncbi:high-affinity branched-chain amino acid ABC transporter permease LivM [Methylobacterium sp. J-076]|uniref:high-affinity branched-chain amino acid ABC transporter permease LivM n=1 Tax=Methylobacterium sp. J-076 TaxID=2836655 RepID=UPI001FBA66B6|nr:high-affinity branched-chain amino acid ABC transporter permease LivM [Methylobacterium sp. J-076]MCJ2013212.1 high-affinity branched-chain amino acid ABC transporter permease LivM [Methylobacterium sp. J-076]
MTRPVTDALPASAMAGILRDAALYALVAFGLCVPLIAYRADPGPGSDLVLVPRWGLVAILCAAVFGLRLLQRLVLLRRDARRALAPSPAQATEAVGGEPDAGQAVSKLGLRAFVAVALTLPVLAVLATGDLASSRYWIDLGILILTYVMLGWGLNIVVGLAGLLDLGYVAFYAVGAYSYALLSTTFGLSFWVCLPLAGLFAGLWGMLLGFPVLRLRGDYLAIVTLAFGEIIRLVLINWTDVTGGAAGVSSIPRATFFGIPFSPDEDGFAAKFGLEYDSMHRVVFLYYLILVLALITNLVTLRLRRLPIGRAWEALREDEIACRSLGIDTTATKLTAFALGAAFGGIAGSFFAVRQGFISPESFTFLESAIILAIVVLGGMGSQFGVAIAAVAMVAGPEMLRNLGGLKAVFGEGFDPSEYRLLLFGLAMVAMMVWRPRGLISVRMPSVTLGKRRAISGAHVSEGHG